jgi:ABC-type polysaccharide/polyol phosphate export permease
MGGLWDSAPGETTGAPLLAMKVILLALWSYRGFIFGSMRREFQARYRNSLLGAAWAVLNPLAMIVVYTVIFSQIMRARVICENITV